MKPPAAWLALTAAVLLVPAAAAEDGVWYAGGGLAKSGYFNNNDTTGAYVPPGTANTATISVRNRNKFTGHVLAGYAFGIHHTLSDADFHVAVETEYFDAGQYDAGWGSMKITGADVSGVCFISPSAGQWQPGRKGFAFLLKAGISGTWQNNTPAAGAAAPAPRARAGLSLGVGTQYDFSAHGGARLSLDFYPVNGPVPGASRIVALTVLG